MITPQDLQEAIAECQGQRNPNANTCIKLAAFLTIQRELYGERPEPESGYSCAAMPDTVVGDYGDSDFLRAVAGKDSAAMWAVMDELMETLMMVNRRVYDSVMRRIR